MRHCPSCDSPIEGRINKRHCNAACRAAASKTSLVKRVEALEGSVAHLKALLLKERGSGSLLSPGTQKPESY